MKKLIITVLLLTGLSAYAMEELLAQLNGEKSQEERCRIALAYFEQMQAEHPERLERQKAARQRANELDEGIKCSLSVSED